MVSQLGPGIKARIVCSRFTLKNILHRLLAGISMAPRKASFFFILVVRITKLQKVKCKLPILVKCRVATPIYFPLLIFRFDTCEAPSLDGSVCWRLVFKQSSVEVT